MKKIKVLTLSVAALLFTASPVWADVVLYNFNNPTGTLGTSQTYTNDSITVTATGYVVDGKSAPKLTDLYGKSDGGDEVGLGIAGGSDNEIETKNFIQLDLTNLNLSNPTSETMSIGSVQSGEGWAIYGSNIAGVGTGGTFLQSGSKDFPTTFSLAPNSYNYLFITSTSGDVLLSTLGASIAVPEPSTTLLLGSIVLLISFYKRRKSMAVVK